MKWICKFDVRRHPGQATWGKWSGRASTLLFLVAILLLPLQSQAVGVELIKTVQKSFRVSDSDVLELRNKYGKVDVHTWDKAYISVSITIRAFGQTESIAQKRMDQVKISEKRSSDIILLQTVTQTGNELRLDKKGVSVSYEVKMPPNNPVKVNNHFGNVFISDRKGNVGCELSNGNLVMGRLQGENNEIKFSFGQADLAYVEGGKIECSYGHLTINECGNVFLKTDGAEVKIDRARELDLLANLGDIDILRVRDLSGRYSSAHFKVRRLERSLNMQVRYAASFELDKIDADFSSISIKASYCPMQMNFEEGANFRLEADMQNGELRYDARTVSMTIIEDEVKGNAATYLGRFGSEKDPAARVLIRSEYGNIKIRQ